MEEVIAISVKDHFGQLGDPRISRKTHHKLVDIIVITLCAVTAGADDWVEIAAFGKEREHRFKTFLELPGGDPLSRYFWPSVLADQSGGIWHVLCQLDS